MEVVYEDDVVDSTLLVSGSVARFYGHDDEPVGWMKFGDSLCGR
jgi:hypothetical protein